MSRRYCSECGAEFSVTVNNTHTCGAKCMAHRLDSSYAGRAYPLAGIIGPDAWEDVSSGTMERFMWKGMLNSNCPPYLVVFGYGPEYNRATICLASSPVKALSAAHDVFQGSKYLVYAAARPDLRHLRIAVRDEVNMADCAFGYMSWDLSHARLKSIKQHRILLFSSRAGR